MRKNNKHKKSNKSSKKQRRTSNAKRNKKKLVKKKTNENNLTLTYRNRTHLKPKQEEYKQKSDIYLTILIYSFISLFIFKITLIITAIFREIDITSIWVIGPFSIISIGLLIGGFMHPHYSKKENKLRDYINFLEDEY